MRRRDRKGGDGFDPQRVVMAAVEAFMEGQTAGRRAEDVESDDHRGRRRVSRGAVALGVVVGIGARGLYRRARSFDLERVARAVEKRMVN
jgi:hypothetical protein